MKKKNRMQDKENAVGKTGKNADKKALRWKRNLVHVTMNPDLSDTTVCVSMCEQELVGMAPDWRITPAHMFILWDS